MRRNEASAARVARQLGSFRSVTDRLTERGRVRLVYSRTLKRFRNVFDEAHRVLLIDQVGEGRRDELEQERGRIREVDEGRVLQATRISAQY